MGYGGFGRGEAKARAATRRLREALDLVPDNPIQHFRAGRGQVGVAAKSDITQQHLSDIERGRKRLTNRVAERLGPTLGVDPGGLMALDRLAALKAELSGEGVPDVQTLLNILLFVEQNLPSGQLKDDIRGVIAGAVKEAMEGLESKKPAAATKTEKRTTRDNLGLRTDDPFGITLDSRKTATDDAPRGKNGRVLRDAAGRVKHKKFDPDRRRSA